MNDLRGIRDRSDDCAVKQQLLRLAAWACNQSDVVRARAEAGGRKQSALYRPDVAVLIVVENNVVRAVGFPVENNARS